MSDLLQQAVALIPNLEDDKLTYQELHTALRRIRGAAAVQPSTEEAQSFSKAVARVYNAWTTPGRNPPTHRRAMHALHNDWPVLANAVEALVSSIDGGVPGGRHSYGPRRR